MIPARLVLCPITGALHARELQQSEAKQHWLGHRIDEQLKRGWIRISGKSTKSVG